jgi:hypothetical protein
MSDLRAELAETVDEAQWEWLQPHAKRDAVLVVDRQLDLVDVGMAIANDNVASVQQWIGQNLLAKPSSAQLSTWADNPAQRFSALIIQPYVLVQEG